MSARPVSSSPPPFPTESHLPGPVKWVQQWLDVLFLSWSVPVADLRPRVPATLEIDTRDGLAWVSLVLFRLKVRPGWLPFYPGLATTNEVNFRTYVTCAGKPGVYFLSMHANNRLAVWSARWLTPFPYVRGKVAYARSGDDYLFAEGNAAHPFRFRPVGAGTETASGSLDEWLMERYSAFVDRPGNRIVVAPVAHPRWSFRPVEVLDPGQRIGPWWSVAPERPPDVLTFSPGVEARFGPFQRLSP